MRFTSRCAVWVIALFLGLSTAAADENSTATDARQSDAWRVQHRWRHRRAVRHRSSPADATSGEQQKNTDGNANGNDSRPQFLVDAILVKVVLNASNMTSGVNIAFLDKGERGTPETEDIAGVQISSVSDVDKSLQYLKDFGETKVIATPRLLAFDRQPAEIHIGGQLGYATSIVTETSVIETVQYIPLGSRVRVRPTAMPDGKIRLEVHAEQNSGQLVGGIPQTTTLQITTNVVLQDGATVEVSCPVFVALPQEWKNSTFWSQLPYIGDLFQNHEDATATREQLILFLSARAITPQQLEKLSAGEMGSTLK